MIVDTLSRSLLIYFFRESIIVLTRYNSNFFPLLDLWRMNILVIEGLYWSSACTHTVDLYGYTMCCSAITTKKMQCNVVEMSKTGFLLSTLSLLIRLLQGADMSTAFS